jgi:hypothetical protein
LIWIFCLKEVFCKNVLFRGRYILLTSEVRDSVAVKGKAIPLQAWTGPEDFRRLRLPDFKTIGT